MTKDVRIIDGKLKVVEISKEGKIIEIIGDYHKKNTYIGPNKKELKTLKENERIHELNYGNRYKYQKESQIKGPNQYRQKLLKCKAEQGIVDNDVLNIKNSSQLLDDWSRNKGFKNYDEYLNIIALGRGFTCYAEYEKVWMYYPEMPSPIKENRKDTRFLGVYIAENAVAKIFKESKKMPYANIGFDVVCPKGYKIDVKSTVLNKYNTFNFHINQNNIADYFILIGFNNIIELEPIYMWIIKSTEDISGCPIKNLEGLAILNEPDYLDIYKKYENPDKLKELKCVCNIFDAKNKIQINDYSVPSKSLILDIILQIRRAGMTKILPTDILHILEEKRKNKPGNKLSLVPADECKF